MKVEKLREFQHTPDWEGKINEEKLTQSLNPQIKGLRGNEGHGSIILPKFSGQEGNALSPRSPIRAKGKGVREGNVFDEKGKSFAKKGEKNGHLYIPARKT